MPVQTLPAARTRDDKQRYATGPGAIPDVLQATAFFRQAGQWSSSGANQAYQTVRCELFDLVLIDNSLLDLLSLKRENDFVSIGGASVWWGREILNIFSFL